MAPGARLCFLNDQTGSDTLLTVIHHFQGFFSRVKRLFLYFCSISKQSLMGAAADGKKELVAIQDGQWESEQSWKELLLDVQARGLTIEPKLAVGDGALEFWKAVRQIWPEVSEQRCWVPKTANVLDKLPKSVQPKAKEMRK